MSTNPWNMVYKLATGKIKSCSTFSTIRRPDGTVTTDMEETINVMMEHFIPAEEAGTDNDYHKSIRVQNATQVTNEDDKPFTTAEIREAIHALNKNKSPGENGITREILERAYHLLPKATTAMYNRCLRTACDNITKYRPISLINIAAKVLEKLLIKE